ncbi:MAG: hypothetical protein K0S33_130 [Bacteroidetes bacterium]|jgi:predicted dinucleotide-binding enzyme|nr:hypothetical protein [Bacteroidota bacterium]
MKKAGILGSGSAGQTLAAGFLKHGYDVMIGTRTASKLDKWKASNPLGKVGSFEETAAFGELIVLVSKGAIAKDVLSLAGKQNLSGKTIIDVTNPIDASAPPVNGVLRYFTPANSSLMEDLQAAFPEANFVKAFNSTGGPTMVNPDYNGIIPTMFICGNNDAAKTEVKTILTQFGWDPEDMGKAEAAGTIESLCILWCIPGFLNNQWSHTFKLLKK